MIDGGDPDDEELDEDDSLIRSHMVLNVSLINDC